MRARLVPQLIADVVRTARRDTGTVLVSTDYGGCFADRIGPCAPRVSRARRRRRLDTHLPRAVEAPQSRDHHAFQSTRTSVASLLNPEEVPHVTISAFCSVSQTPHNNAMQQTGRPGTRLAVSAPPHISSKGLGQGARPSRPAGYAQRWPATE